MAQIPSLEAFMKSSYVNPKYPFTLEQFRSPEIAVRRYGLAKALSMYQDLVEPQYTDNGLPGLPKDWEWRKFFIYHRDKKQCQRCGKREPALWDVHHKVHRGDGGNHALDNLELLCNWPCHKEGEHPEKNRRQSLETDWF